MSFFSNIEASVEAAFNIKTISTVVTDVYTVLTKLQSVVAVIEQEATTLGVAGKLVTYLPAVTSTLTEVIAAFTKFAPLLGIALDAAALDVPADPLADLQNAVNGLHTTVNGATIK